MKGQAMFAYFKVWLDFKADRRAVTALECGLIAALIAVVIISGATALGSGPDEALIVAAAKVSY